MNKRSKILLIATALATIYVVYLISYFYGGTINAGDTAEAVGGAIATAFVTEKIYIIAPAKAKFDE